MRRLLNRIRGLPWTYIAAVVFAVAGLFTFLTSGDRGVMWMLLWVSMTLNWYNAIRSRAPSGSLGEALDLVDEQNKLLFEQNQLIRSLNNRIEALQKVSKN